MEADAIRELLEAAFPEAVEVSVVDRTGGGDHFQVTLADPTFDGIPLLDQHRRVNDVLAPMLRDGSIHELRIRTRSVKTT